MASRPALPIQPLTNRVPIVDENGNPTPYFIRYLKERGLDIDGRVTPEQVMQLIVDWSEGRFINTELPLIGGGALSSDLTLEHDVSGVAAGTYGDATNVARVTVDDMGHVTDVEEIPITGGSGSVPVWGFSSAGTAVSTSGSSSKGFIFQPQETMTIDSIAMIVDGHGVGTPVDYTISLLTVNNATAAGTVTTVEFTGPIHTVNQAAGQPALLYDALTLPEVLSPGTNYAIIATASVAAARVRHDGNQNTLMIPFLALCPRGFFSSAAIAPAAAYTVGDVFAGGGRRVA